VVKLRTVADPPVSVRTCSPTCREPARTQPRSVVKKGWFGVVSIDPVSSARCCGFPPDHGGAEAAPLTSSSILLETVPARCGDAPPCGQSVELIAGCRELLVEVANDTVLLADWPPVGLQVNATGHRAVVRVGPGEVVPSEGVAAASFKHSRLSCGSSKRRRLSPSIPRIRSRRTPRTLPSNATGVTMAAPGSWRSRGQLSSSVAVPSVSVCPGPTFVQPLDVRHLRTRSVLEARQPQGHLAAP
jgi:hypothetical protein